jgi:hypothetical protein
VPARRAARRKHKQKLKKGLVGKTPNDYHTIMTRAVSSAVLLVQFTVLWAAVEQRDRLAGSEEPNPAITVSPASLDFGLVGVGRSKDLKVTVRNAGGGVLKGIATVKPPSTVAGDSYSLRSGQSQSLTVRYRPTAEGTNNQSLLLTGGSAAIVPVMGSARAFHHSLQADSVSPASVPGGLPKRRRPISSPGTIPMKPATS